MTIKKIINEARKFEWKHHNIILLIVSIIVAYYLVKSPSVLEAIKGIGNLGYFGAFFAGMFFTYGLTTAPATATLLILGDSLKNPMFISLIAASGAVISDYIIFRFVRERLLKELEITAEEILGTKIRIKIKQNSFPAKLIPILAGLIIASPLPDELGAALLGAVKIKTSKFVQYSFIFNFLGIFVITSLGSFFI